MGKTAILKVSRLFTEPKSNGYDMLTWIKRDSIIVNPTTGATVFEQKDVEFPDSWSLSAVNVVTQKYFSGMPDSSEREASLKDVINRVVNTITRQGLQENYFDSEQEAEDFKEELKFILASQRASFNSPVWFNIGISSCTQQASACFILGIEDTMPAILNWYQEEGLIFKGGSGSGINLSAVRSSIEPLDDSAGMAAGPLSFMRGADASAGAIKSGGKTRRAAKMVILNADHPDIEEFTWAKAREERKLRDLQAAGWDMSLDGKDISSVQYLNANNAVRVTDEFMQAVISDREWDLKAVTTNKTVRTVRARELMKQFSEAAWQSADPGIQFDTTINHWNTTPNAGRINASNPFSEYMHLDNSACNLASINLLKYLRDDNTFDIEAFMHTVELMFTAQEILVGYGEYPTEKIAKNTKAYRQLGIGYANLGATLMAQGIAYDSAEGRAQAAAITAIMTGYAYATSAKIARKIGPFAGFHKDRDGMIQILKQHRLAVNDIDASLVSENLLSAAATVWDQAVELAELYGVRNAQASLLAPTGTIGVMMDCETTGIEPDIGLVKIKKLLDGGSLHTVNQTVPRALKELGYSPRQVQAIVDYIDDQKTIIGAPEFDEKHLNVFACSIGDNVIEYRGHVKMMAAVQPFLSGAISKTVNMPEEASVEDVEQLYIDSWQMGLKAVTIYRDNCKVIQDSQTDKKDDHEAPTEVAPSDTVSDKYIVKGAMRRPLPKIRASKTFAFTVADSRGYAIVGEYEDGTPGELFVSFAKHGSTLRGIMDAFAISVSHGLQYGVPLKKYVNTFTSTSFAPSGITDDPEIRTASSLIDYIFRRLALTYLPFDDRLELGLASIDDMLAETQTSLLGVDEAEPSVNPTGAAQAEASHSTSAESIDKKPEVKKVKRDDTAPMCFNCGNQTQRSGSCYVCAACGSTTGCS